MNTGHTRRLQAILAADVVGYSRQMNRDEEGTLGRLKDLEREVIDVAIGDHGGEVVKRLGDGVLAVFPSAVTALRAAREIREHAARRQADEQEPIVFRIGLNVGDVIVTEDDIYGDGVNIASRIESIADPGGIALSGSVHDHVRAQDPGPFDDLGERRVKNIEHPVRVYRVRFEDSPMLSSVGRRRLPVLFAVAGMLLFAIMLGLAWVYWPGRDAPADEAAVDPASKNQQQAAGEAGRPTSAAEPTGDVVTSRAAWPTPELDPAEPPPTSSPSSEPARLLESLTEAIEENLGGGVSTPSGKGKTPPGQAKGKKK